MGVGAIVGRGCTDSLGRGGAGRIGSRFQLPESFVLLAVSSRAGAGAGDGVGSTLAGAVMMVGAGTRTVAITGDGDGVAVGRGVGTGVLITGAGALVGRAFGMVVTSEVDGSEIFSVTGLDGTDCCRVIAARGLVRGAVISGLRVGVGNA